MISLKKIKNLTLFVVIVFSTLTPNTSLAVNFTEAEKNMLMGFVSSQQSGLFKKAIWLIAPALIQITLSEIFIMFLSSRKTEEEKERDKIENLISISHAMKNQLNYIKPICKDSSTLKTIEKKYVNSFSKILELHDEHLEKYTKKKGGENRK